MTQRKSFKELQFSDAFMFAAAMEDEDICREVLERVLGIPIRRVKVRAEASILVNSDFRGVRLDVYADDEAGTVFDVEMRTTDKPKSFIIFICTFDPFGYGRYRYTIDSRCRETGEEFGDEAYKIFLNTKGSRLDREPEELICFLKYVEDAAYASENTRDSLIQKIDARIKQIKHERGMEVQYMLFSQMLNEERREARLEGHQEGREEERLEGQDLLLKLIKAMTAGGDADKITLLGENPQLLREMYDKYHIEV